MLGVVHGRGHVWQEWGMHGRSGRGHVWERGAYMAGGVCGGGHALQGVCMAGGMCGRGEHAWQRGACGQGGAWHACSLPCEQN